jgi:hypothetical protein
MLKLRREDKLIILTPNYIHELFFKKEEFN